MEILFACLFPICCILFTLAVDSNIAVGVIAIIALLAYIIIKKIESVKKAKEYKEKLYNQHYNESGKDYE